MTATFDDINEEEIEEFSDLPVNSKLKYTEEANEIYRHQLRVMQETLAGLRSTIQDEENIIENLMLRYDLGIINQCKDENDHKEKADNINSINFSEFQNTLEIKEITGLHIKNQTIVKSIILDNFERREMVNELRDENYHLRNEIYELEDKVNRQELQITKIKKHLEEFDKKENSEETKENDNKYDNKNNNNNKSKETINYSIPKYLRNQQKSDKNIAFPTYTEELDKKYKRVKFLLDNKYYHQDELLEWIINKCTIPSTEQHIGIVLSHFDNKEEAKKFLKENYLDYSHESQLFDELKN